MEKRFRLKQIIENVGPDRIINSELKVQDGVVYLSIKNNFKYEQGNWYQDCEGRWINLQGGIPDYYADSLIDELLFEEA